MTKRHALLIALSVSLAACASSVRFPVKPELFIDRFNGAEGITFNGEGRLFIGADRAIWMAEPDGTTTRIADVHTHLGQAGIGSRDILAADFGPTNVFRDGPNDDGLVWRITPEGEKTVVARGIADPNFILVLRDGSFLISDDGTDKIYRVVGDQVSVWSSDVEFPNGMVLSRDERTLYVAQIFSSIQPKPVVFDDRIWAVPLDGLMPAGKARVVARTGLGGGVDGLAVDERGRVYVAANVAGQIWRFDPRTSELILIAEGMPGVASLVFGEGKFDREALYATGTARGGGNVWKIRVGARGARLHR